LRFKRHHKDHYMSTNLVAPRQSAADILVFKRPRVMQHWLDPIREMLNGCGTNKNDKAIVAIEALIGDGVDTGSEIVAAMGLLGFDKGHAGITLKAGLGRVPALHRWSKNDDGRYRLLI
jgi:hypothetical protein